MLIKKKPATDTPLNFTPMGQKTGGPKTLVTKKTTVTAKTKKTAKKPVAKKTVKKGASAKFYANKAAAALAGK